jgi:hypothetical protein
MQTLDRGQPRRNGDFAKMGVSITRSSVIAPHAHSSEYRQVLGARRDRRLDDLVNERRRLADLYQAGLIDIIEMLRRQGDTEH